MNNLGFSECLDGNICPICKKCARVSFIGKRQSLDVSCEFCGRYEIARALLDDNFVCSDGKYNLTKLSLYLRNNKLRKSSVLLCQEPIDDNDTRVSPIDVDAWYKNSVV